MNAILITDNAGELDYFNEAKKIIDANNKKHKHEKKTSKTKIFVIIVIIIAIIALLFCTIFALININSDKILENISVLEIDISNLTQDEAKAKIKEKLDERLTTDIILKHNEETYTFIPNEIEFNYDIESAIKELYQIGRNGNIFENNFAILNQKFNKKDITPKVSINENKLEEIEPKLNESFGDGVKQPEYSVDGTSLKINKGKDGYKVKQNELRNSIIRKMLLVNYNTDPIDIPVELGKCDEINLDEIHSEIFKQAVDATFTKDPYKITASETGLDFDMSVDEAKNMLASQDQEEYTIKLKVLYPNVTTDDISLEAFPDVLASYSTNYSSSGSSRANNVELATRKIDGTVLMPGETFSYNATVGKRTKAAGFQEAGAYSNGQVVSEVGGGICQVSTTLYNAVLRSNLEVVDRSNHMFMVGYVPIGTDATVSWGAPDLKFKNNRDYAIKIVATTSGRNVYVKIYGLHQDNDCDVEIESYRTGTVAYKTTYTTDSSLGSGQTKVIQKGSNGSTSVTYKILKKDGEVVSKEVVSRDTYQPHNEIIARGS